jgi:hypothetical protein
MVSALKLDTIKSLSGNEAMTISEGGVPLLNVPAFYAYRNGTQSITSSTSTVVQLNTEMYDTKGWFDTSTYQFTPQIAGYYQFNWVIYIRASSGATRGLCTLQKSNGDLFRGAYLPAFNGAEWCASGGALVYMNGTTDYVELAAYLTATSPVIQGATSGDTYLCGFLARGA